MDNTFSPRIYIMRDPIRRAISHHTHLFQHLLTEEVLSQAENKRLTAFNNQINQRQLQNWRYRLIKSAPPALFNVVKTILTRPAPAPPEVPSERSLRYLYDRHSPKLDKLKDLLAPEAADWNLEESIESLLNKETTEASPSDKIRNPANR